MQKVAVVTGGGTGIGREVAFHFAEKNTAVVIAGRNRVAGSSVVEEIRKKGGKALFTPVDLLNSGDVEKMVDETMATFGRLDFAFNNAGIGGSGEIVEQEEEEFDRIIGTNIKGLWLCLKHQLRVMRKQGAGAIVNNLSVHAFRSVFPGIAAYAASKQGGIALTKIAAIENAAHGIRINAIAPGPIDTDMFRNSLSSIGGEKAWVEKIPAGRVGTTEEVARAVLWLSSDEASFINGEVLAVDGGFLAS